ncbi:MAG: excinuclease ABC subunit UvrA, partial [Candidatus Phytoplasma stylosanthis]|nr:excinuclease ABC subunit UvrA [Candidatus Phytoplasma stylosanthis]
MNYSNLKEKIIIKKARENNLKNIDLEITKFKLVVFTGISGSGKSSLVFDVIYQEGKRIFIESLNFHDRKFLETIKKPDVDLIEGLSPVISIEKKKIISNSKDTVGTITGIYLYLQLIFAHIAVFNDPESNQKFEKYNIEQITNKLLTFYPKEKIVVLSPILKNPKEKINEILEKLILEGFNRFFINKNIIIFENKKKLDNFLFHSEDNISIIIDHFTIQEDSRSRLNSSLELAIKLNQEKILILLQNK